MVKAEATDARTLVVTLSGKQNRYTILTVAGLPIFSKAYYTAHDFDSSSLDPPLGSGAYKVGNIAAGRFIEYERVADYWGKDLPVNVGFANFDIIRIDFFKERQTAFEAFKKGDITFREEFTSITWAQDYDFPAVTAGKVKKTTEFPSEKSPALQGWFFNTRRAKFRDPRTRLAIALAFDFEWTNRNLFFGSYARLASYFEKSDFAAKGPPSPAELKLLEPFRADLPPEVFGEPYVPPKTDGTGRDRKILKQASDLLAAAGWKQSGNDLVDEEGAPLEVEFLIDAQVFERILTPYVANLKALGIAATIRQVDPAQYQARTNDFDFDVIGSRVQLLGRRRSTGWRSSSARRPPTRRAATTSPASRTRRSTRCSTKLPAVNSRAELMTLTTRRSTACCAPATTGSRTGTSPTTASATGTSSAGRPRRSRTTPSRRRRRGGSTATGPAGHRHGGLAARQGDD